jgi:DNA mismatch endonuclease (patch repair protein)
MAAVKSGNTVPEISLRKALHARGLRYRLHVRELAGKPDLAFPKFRAVVFVHGCFWHAHDCGACRIPQTNNEYWTRKIARNSIRDAQTRETLRASGWRVAIVWECALRGPRKQSLEQVSETVMKWLRGGSRFLEVRGVAGGAARPSRKV